MGSSGLDTQIQLIALAITLLIFLVILELVRRRRLVERYALLWLFAGLTLVVLAVWRDLLDTGAEWLGIAYPPNALFIVAFGVAFVLLLHFSVATSRLSEETKILAQEVARLDEEVRMMRGAAENGGAQPAEERVRVAPSSTSTTDQ
ncbi:MAG: DUF2304 domain-containing protein [Solirubrobacterales bacterium]